MEPTQKSSWSSAAIAGMGAMLLVAPAGARAAGAATAGDRVALVIGNSHYGGRDNISGIEDAKGMRTYLQQMHFTVLPPVYDGSLAEMRAGLKALEATILNASVVIFFYSGHGFQLGQANYLQPVGSTPRADRAVALDEVMTSLTRAPDTAVKLVFLDACRTSLLLPPGGIQGLAEPKTLSVRPPQTMIGFATLYGELSASGSADGRSPFSNALLLSIREPGLELGDLIKRVHQDVLGHTFGQSPIEDGYAAIPRGFYLQPAVTVQPSAQCVDDGLVMLLNGSVAFNSGDQTPPQPLRLRAGDNSVELLVYNQKSFKNNNAVDRPEGWKFWLKLLGPDGTEVPCPEVPAGQPCLAAREEVPLKDGPHHGQMFVAARAILRVDPTGQGVQLVNRDVEVWQREAPLAAQDQAVLYPTAIPLVGREVRVRGNRIAAEAVAACMPATLPGQLGDLLAVALSALNGDPKPLEGFTQQLSQCVRQKLNKDLRVSVTVENPAEDTPPPPPNNPCG